MDTPEWLLIHQDLYDHFLKSRMGFLPFSPTSFNEVDSQTSLKYLLMNNYSHPYSDYVNHILNKSPSKTAYSFSKAERFPQKLSQQDYLEFDPLPPQEIYRSGGRNSPQRRQKSPMRARDSEKRVKEKGLTHRQERSARGNAEHHLESGTRNKNGSRSKSPIRQVNPYHQHQTCTHGHHKTTRLAREYSYYQDLDSKHNFFKRSPSKSPLRTHTPSRQSPSKTFTQRLQDSDHISKNITINGYYPTGIQLNAQGKSPVSTYKNTTSYSFGRGTQKQRYQYLVKSEDPLGPGYYDNFSEFGQQRKY